MSAYYLEVWLGELLECGRIEVLNLMPLYDIKDQRNIVVASSVLHNFIRIHDREDVGFGWDECNLGKSGSNAVAIAVKKT